MSGGARSGASNEVRLFVNVPQPPSAPDPLLGLVNGSTAHLAWKGDVRRRCANGLRPGRERLGTGVDCDGRHRSRPRSRTCHPAPTRWCCGQRMRAGASPPTAPITLSLPGTCSGAPQAPAGLWVERNGSTVTAGWDPPAAGPAPTGYVLNVSGALLGEFPTTTRALSGVVGRRHLRAERSGDQPLRYWSRQRRSRRFPCPDSAHECPSWRGAQIVRPKDSKVPLASVWTAELGCAALTSSPQEADRSRFLTVAVRHQSHPSPFGRQAPLRDGSPDSPRSSPIRSSAEADLPRSRYLAA